MAETKTYYTQIIQKVQNADGSISNANILPITDGGAVDVYVGDEKQTLQETIDNLSDFAFKDTVPEASIEKKGIVSLAEELVNDNTKAATIATVKIVNDNAVHNEGDETISGEKKFTDSVNINGALFQTSYDAETDTKTLNISFQ